MASEWESYFQPATYDPITRQGVLKNRTGATTAWQLHHDDSVRSAVRLQLLPEHLGEVPISLRGLRAVHGYLFQDVYPWAGQLRTVAISKGGAPFAPTDSIERVVRRATSYVSQQDWFRSHSDPAAAHSLAWVFNAINYAHPFREGNGRTLRAFMTQIAESSGRRLDWASLTAGRNEEASHHARTTGDLTPLVLMFRDITTTVEPRRQHPPGTDTAVRGIQREQMGHRPRRAVGMPR